MACPVDSSTDFPALDYTAEYNNAWVLVVPNVDSPSDGNIKIEASCVITDCAANEFVDSGACRSCPSGTISPKGSVAISACVECPGGTEQESLFSDNCVLTLTALRLQQQFARGKSSHFCAQFIAGGSKAGCFLLRC